MAVASSGSLATFCHVYSAAVWACFSVSAGTFVQGAAVAWIYAK